MPYVARAVLGAYSSCALHGHQHEPDDGCGKGLTVARAMLGAVGEALERYSARAAAMGTVLRGAAPEFDGDLVLPHELCPYSDEQLVSQGFPYRRVEPTAPINWAAGHWLDTEERVLIPALPVFYDYHVPPEEAFCQVTSNGLAAGPSIASASFAASLELIERDAIHALLAHAPVGDPHCPG